MSVRRNDRGFVLVCVMWVLAMLTVLTIGFGHRVVLERRAAAYSLDVARAKMFARGAVYRGMLALRNKAFEDLVAEQYGVFHLGQPWAQRVNLFEETGFFDVDESYADDVCYYSMRDESSLININMATLYQDLVPELPRLEMDEGVISYHAIEQLRELRGVSDKEWFGDGKGSGLRDVVTIYGPLVVFQPMMGNIEEITPRVNLNTAGKAVLLRIADGDESAVEAMLAYRAGGDGEIGTSDDQGFNNYEDLSAKTGINDETLAKLRAFGGFGSFAFTITGFCTLRHGRVRASATAVVYLDAVAPRIVDWKEESLGA